MKINEIITESLNEAPLADYVPLGDFNKPGPFRNKVDKKLVTHPVNQLKTAKFLENTPYDFRLFFSNIPGTAKQKEIGLVDAEKVTQVFGDQVGQQIIQGSGEAITIVFLGNYGDAAVIMTPWIMAHRIGHAIQASNRGSSIYSGAKMPSWEQVENSFFSEIRSMLINTYGKREPERYTRGGPNWGWEKEYNALFNAIGTQRSSREGQIRRPYEFIYEMFAQYLKDGHVTLNPFPQSLTYGKKAWGNPTQFMTARSSDPDQGKEQLGQDLQWASERLENTMNYLFSDVLDECVGKIFLM